MSRRVLVSAPYMQPALDEYRSVFDEHKIELVVPPVHERLSEADLLQWLDGVDGVISGDDQFTKRVFQSAPKLKVIAKWGTGIDSIDCEAARRYGVQVLNTPGAFSDPVADTVMGYVLAFARRLPWMDADIRAGRWEKRLSVALKECTLGIIGVGNIGKAVIRRAISFGMTVLGNDIVELSVEFIAGTNLQVVSKDELLSRADFVSLNCTLNRISHHLIGEREFDLMQGSAYLINTARGPLIDERALVEALQGNRIAGAALDVFEQEPLPSDSPLRALDNCLLAPHSANSSPEAWRRVHESTIRNLLAGLGITT